MGQKIMCFIVSLVLLQLMQIILLEILWHYCIENILKETSVPSNFDSRIMSRTS